MSNDSFLPQLPVVIDSNPVVEVVSKPVVVEVLPREDNARVIRDVRNPTVGRGRYEIVRVEGARNMREAFDKAGMGFKVEKTPQFVYGLDGKLEKVDGSYVTRRMDTGTHLGVVGEGYTPIDNWDGSELLDLIVADGRGTIENVGYLRGGAKVFAQVKLGEWNVPGLVKADSMRDYLTFTNSHDGTMVATFGPTSVRVVCENTHLFANRESGKRGARVKHTKNSANKLEAAKNAIQGFLDQFSQYRTDCGLMAATKLSLPEMNKIAFEVFGEPIPVEASKQSKNAVEDILERSVGGIGNKAFAGTAWGLFNGFTEYVTHGGMGTRERGIEPKEALLAESRMFGTGKKLMDSARNVIIDAITVKNGGGNLLALR
jgi:phage/plasmid-like protein (TIGR03299 family)